MRKVWGRVGGITSPLKESGHKPLYTERKMSMGQDENGVEAGPVFWAVDIIQSVVGAFESLCEGISTFFAWIPTATKWASDNAVLDTFEFMVIAAGVYFALKQIRLNTTALQANALVQLTDQGRALQLQILQDVDLRSMVLGESNPSRWRKQNFMRSIVLNHYSTVFDMTEMGALPSFVRHDMEIDLKQFVSSEDFPDRWEKTKKFYTPKFQAYVDDMRANSADAKPLSHRTEVSGEE